MGQYKAVISKEKIKMKKEKSKRESEVPLFLLFSFFSILFSFYRKSAVGNRKCSAAIAKRAMPIAFL